MSGDELEPVLAEPVQHQALPPHPMPPGVVPCPRCGQPVAVGAPRCVRCGAGTSAADLMWAYQPGLTLVVLLLLCAFVAYCWHDCATYQPSG